MPDLTPLYAEIKKALENAELGEHQSLEIMRRFLAQAIEADRYLLGRIERIGRTERRPSVFPDKVGRLLVELIRFRNAASHRSRIPIGPYECRRSAFALVVVYVWWNRERAAIDWTKTPREIVLDCVQRNSPR